MILVQKRGLFHLQLEGVTQAVEGKIVPSVREDSFTMTLGKP